MGLFKNIANSGYTGPVEYEQNFCEYTETFGKSPVLISCDMNFAKMVSGTSLNCCLKIQMDVYVQEDLPTLISESEASYVSMVRSSLSEHIGGRFVGQGIIGSSGVAFLMFYIPERSAAAAKKMLTEVFLGSFRHVQTTVLFDPEGNQYFKYLYPSELQIKQSENSRILKQLKTYGDNGKTPRPVKFNLVFPSKKAALSFYSRSMEKGFEYVDLVSEDPPEGMVLPRYNLVIVKTIPFDIDLLLRVDSYLLNLSAEFDGEYKSLETDILE